MLNKSHSSWWMLIAVPGLIVVGACSDSTTSAPRISAPDESSSAVEWAGNPELAKTLATARAATAPFHDPAVAAAAGYRTSVTSCESSPIGAMGIHASNPALLGLIPGTPLNGTDAVIDPARPEVLLYEPQADGSRRLVGIEYVVFRSAWDALHDSPPTLNGIPFNQRFFPNAHGLSDHYELHVWIWRNNPLGMFAPWNPKVSCL